MTTSKRAMSRPVDGIVHPLPCPFCGSDNLRIEVYGIECRNCGVWMGDGTQRRTIGKTLLDSWNHRVITTDSVNDWEARALAAERNLIGC